MSDTFRDYVTSVAFHISLSGNMILEIGDVRDEDVLYHKGYVTLEEAQRVYPRPSRGGNRITTLKSLERRGLIGNDGPPRGWFMTEAGDKIVDLLILAGLLGPSRLEDIPYKHQGVNIGIRGQ